MTGNSIWSRCPSAVLLRRKGLPESPKAGGRTPCGSGELRARTYSLPDSIITRCDGSIAWERLASLVEQSDMPHKGEAVDVLRNVPEYTYNDKGVLTDSKKKHLMELQYGRTWYYMLEHFFPQVRNASVVFVTVRPKAGNKKRYGRITDGSRH